MTDPRPQYEPTWQEVALRGWVVASLDTWTTRTHTAEAVYANQDGPRPRPPYASLQVTSDLLLGRPARRVTDTQAASGDYEAYTISHWEGVVAVQFFGPQHRLMAATAIAALDRPEVLEDLISAGVFVEGPVGNIQDLTAIRDTHFEGRSQIDVRYRYAIRDDFEVPGLERIVATVECDTEIGTLTATVDVT